jgi:hypothetical protein
MPAGGSDYLRLMSDQSRRAHDFERQMRWFRLRGRLAEPVHADLTPTEEPVAPLPPD